MRTTATKSGDEVEVMSKKARREYSRYERAGVTSGIKRQVRRRDRHEVRIAIRIGKEF